jgi:hypothetical protein
VSSIVPETDLLTLISLKSTLSGIIGLTIFKTASTAIGERVLLLPETIFDDKEVLTHYIKVSLSVSSTGILIDFNISIDFIKAMWNDSEIYVG